MKTLIVIKEIAIPCSIGVSDTERSKKQTVLVSIQLSIEGENSGISDAIDKTITN